MSLKENLTKYRDAAGLTQKELAQMAGCSQQVIADIESGRTLKPHKALNARHYRANKK